MKKGFFKVEYHPYIQREDEYYKSMRSLLKALNKRLNERITKRDIIEVLKVWRGMVPADIVLRARLDIVKLTFIEYTRP